MLSNRIPMWFGLAFIFLELGLFIIAGTTSGLLSMLTHAQPQDFYTIPSS